MEVDAPEICDRCGRFPVVARFSKSIQVQLSAQDAVQPIGRTARVDSVISKALPCTDCIDCLPSVSPLCDDDVIK